MAIYHADRAVAEYVEQLEAENERLKADVEFLLPRCGVANKVNFQEENRDTGSSSNSIVAIAYDMKIKQKLPYDQYDLDACHRMWEKLPAHRKTQSAIDALTKAEQALNKGE